MELAIQQHHLIQHSADVPHKWGVSQCHGTGVVDTRGSSPMLGSPVARVFNLHPVERLRPKISPL